MRRGSRVFKLDSRGSSGLHRLGGHDALQRLNAGHLVDAHGVAALLFVSLRRFLITIAHGLNLLRERCGVLLFFLGVQPIAALVRLEFRLAQIASHAAGRDRFHAAALHGFVGQFLVRPVRDGASRLLRRFAGQGNDQRDLLRREGSRRTGSRLIEKGFANRPLEFCPRRAAFDEDQPFPVVTPPPSPLAHLMSFQADALRDVFLGLFFKPSNTISARWAKCFGDVRASRGVRRNSC